jgi:gamma-glutamylcyclotransferase (GGCT)/AIG2-like uncharacterized protein YtfP
MNTLLFVYGTLKRGCSNHHHLAGQQFVGAARTTPGYRLYDLGGYPGIVAQPDDREGVIGEVWTVDDEALHALDEFEGVHEGLYRREPIPLSAPFHGQKIDAYIPALPTIGRPDIGSEWTERG